MISNVDVQLMSNSINGSNPIWCGYGLWYFMWRRVRQKQAVCFQIGWVMIERDVGISSALFSFRHGVRLMELGGMR